MKNKHASFAEKVQKGEKVVLYELLPFPTNLTKRDIAHSVSFVTAMVKNFPIDAINIPEVREETRNGTRQGTEISKLEPRIVASYLQNDVDLIINRPIVYLPWSKQKKWLQETHNQFGINTIILVGGESRSIIYPGLSVTDAAATILRDFPQVFLGGITIPTRKGEAKRVLQKSLSGIEFFTTQVLYEAKAIKQFLKEYWELCQKQAVAAKMIVLSFAPATTARDVDLMKWLGVDIPKKTYEFLATGWLGMGRRSVQICKEILEEILEFVERHQIKIPLGLNVEHINRHNLESSFILLESLSQSYLGNQYVQRRNTFYE